MFTAVSILFITFIISFLGTLPLGPINLSMVDVTLRNNLRAGFWFSVAAAFVEMGQSVVALQGSSWISQFLTNSIWTKVIVFAVFCTLGLLFFFKKNTAINQDISVRRGKHFAYGLLIAFLNPQAIPFWLVVLALLESAQIMSIHMGSPLLNIASFLLGTSLGKLGALMLFGILSEPIVRRASVIRNNLNRIIGLILIVLGISQGILAIVG